MFWGRGRFIKLMTQEEALKILKTGENVFITGPAGSGKTHVINQYIAYLRESGVEPEITASTGIAATHIGGTTIHSWSGLGIRDFLSERELEELEERAMLFKRMQKATVLIIDEVSMLHHFRLDMVERVARFLRRREKAFGGLQVILCGDFFQLPPVSRGSEEEPLFIYHSEAWKKMGLKICYLEEQHRQNDKAYLGVLNAIRDNRVKHPEMALLFSRMGKGAGEGVLTRLYPHNADVDRENERELAKLPTKAYSYKMTGKGNDRAVEALKKGCLAPEVLTLKKDARVMFVKNNFEEGYANGTLGTVVECDQYGVKVKTLPGREIKVVPTSWIIEDNGRKVAEINQYPLRLAWAITIHKSQGMSMDAAEIDLSKSFEVGMGYVALSRVRSLAGLTLKGINEGALRMNEEVLQYDDYFRKISAEHAKEIRLLDEETYKQRSNEFLARSGAKAKKTKAEKGEASNTLSLTKELLLQGKNIKEIAKERELTKETIINHLFKLRSLSPDLDLSAIKEELSEKKILTIKDIVQSAGEGNGNGLTLSELKRIIGDRYSYDEIKIAQLFF